jgi:AcrR family transcriptional regulator
MQQRSMRTHARILDAAQKSFAESGYEASGLADICERAGVSKGAFYHHFPSKQAVFLELLQDWLHGLDENLAMIRQEGKRTSQTLIRMTEMVEGIFQAADGRLPIFLEFWTQASRDEKFWEATIAPYHHFQAFFSSLVEEGISDGSLRPVDADTAARVIVSLAIGILLQGLLDPQGADWQHVATQGMYFLMDGLANHQSDKEIE